jgi:membrane-bound metal-dependent hydrolase YbcI (DUF457 family)
VDNATHTLCGLALARLGGDRLGPLAAPTLVVAANFPDIDIVGWPFGGQPWYLCHHRGLTHAVVGLAVESLLLAAIMLWVGRRRAVRPRFWPLALAAALGLSSHLLLDGLNTYGVRPWLPFDATYYYGDTAFIVDPWLWLLFGAAACLGAPRRAAEPPRPTPLLDAAEATLARAEQLGDVGAHEAAGEAAQDALAALGRAKAERVPEEVRDARALGAGVATGAWWVFGALVVLALALFPPLPGAVAALWGGAWLLVLLARGRGVVPARRRHAVAAACVALAVPYLLTLRALDRAALRRAEAWAAEQRLGPVDASVCHPTPVLPWRFHALLACGDTIVDVDIDLRSGVVSPRASVARGLDDPALAHPAVTSTPEFAAWRAFARLPFAARSADGRELILGDARYAPRPEKAWCNLGVELPE